ncbi:MAG: asparagine synthase (glutamine-hydrolyzing) [Syntrophothermus sp.]
MCGIAGYINLDGKLVDPVKLLAMNNVISHRGSDDEGYVLINQQSSEFLNFSGVRSAGEIKSGLPVISGSANSIGANIGLAHKRFSIIDLSAHGHQPFFDKERSCCIVFNGEIYNYPELRENLKSQGVKFYTSSDTEVLLELYKKSGTECFRYMNGFWAVAIYDFRKKQLILSRDRLGKKPIYYTKIDNSIYFASEIKSLLEIPEVAQRKKVNESMVYNWLALGLRDLDFSTAYEGIFTFPSASFSAIEEEFPKKITTFWSVPGERYSEKDFSIEEACSQIRSTLEDSVKIRLRADVPLCVELSGGMDSSALVALASHVSAQKIITYTVRFPEKEWNEEPFARSVAEHYNVDYRVIDNPVDDFWKQILPFTYLEEEPYHSPNLQTNQVIWSLMRKEGIKVSLNGASGDEIFAGYGNYFFNAQLENLKKLQLNSFFGNLDWKEGKSRLRAFLLPFIYMWKSYYNLPFPMQLFNSISDDFIKLSPPLKKYKFITLTETLFSEITNSKIPYWLRSGDKGYMGIPLEVRAPFLDYRMVEIGTKIPYSYLIRDGWHKWIFRKAMEDILPADVVWRRNKMGFPFPYETFYRNSEAIISKIIKETENPYLDYSRQDRFRNNWNVLSFILWYELFINDNKKLLKEIQTMSGDYGNTENYKPGFLNTYNSFVK